MEILAKVTVETLETSTAIRLEIYQRLVPLADDPSSQILYFGPSVQDAECMAFLVQRRGIPAPDRRGLSPTGAR